MSLKRDEVRERIDAVQFARVNDAHKEVAGAGAIQRLVEEGALAMQDGLFQGAFDDIVVEGRSGDLEEPASLHRSSRDFYHHGHP